MYWYKLYRLLFKLRIPDPILCICDRECLPRIGKRGRRNVSCLLPPSLLTRVPHDLLQEGKAFLYVTFHQYFSDVFSCPAEKVQVKWQPCEDYSTFFADLSSETAFMQAFEVNSTHFRGSGMSMILLEKVDFWGLCCSSNIHLVYKVILYIFCTHAT